MVRHYESKVMWEEVIVRSVEVREGTRVEESRLSGNRSMFIIVSLLLIAE